MKLWKIFFLNKTTLLIHKSRTFHQLCISSMNVCETTPTSAIKSLEMEIVAAKLRFNNDSTNIIHACKQASKALSFFQCFSSFMNERVKNIVNNIFFSWMNLISVAFYSTKESMHVGFMKKFEQLLVSWYSLCADFPSLSSLLSWMRFHRHRRFRWLASMFLGTWDNLFSNTHRNVSSWIFLKWAFVCFCAFGSFYSSKFFTTFKSCKFSV